MSKAGGGPGSAQVPTAAAAAGRGRDGRGAEAGVAAAEGGRRRLQPRRQFLLPHQHRPSMSVRIRSPIESGSLKHSALTLAWNAMVRSTIRQCATRRRPSRWRCAPPAWYGPTRCPPIVSGFGSETVFESDIPS
jgi:hypothetical protein